MKLGEKMSTFFHSKCQFHQQLKSRFLYKKVLQSFSILTVCVYFYLFGKKRNQRKSWMYNFGVIGNWNFTSRFFVPKCFAQLFSNISLFLRLHFGKIKSVQKLVVKCWWFWLENKMEIFDCKALKCLFLCKKCQELP